MYAQSAWAWVLAAAGAYLLGSVSGAIIASFTRHGEDIRQFGSGNAGLTNALRTYGVANAVLVAVIDLGKTVLAILLARWLLGSVWGLVIGGGFAVVGHVRPVYYHFRGGKGVLCCTAIVALLDLRLLAAAAAVFALAVACTRTVSIGSLSAAAAAPIFCLLLKEGTVYTLFVTGLCIALFWMHRSNISRILRGEEKPTAIAKRRKP